MKLKDHVSGTSNFTFYREGHLFYTTDTGLLFYVPIEDTDGATFPATEKSIFFMRWIRRQLAEFEAGKENE